MIDNYTCLRLKEPGIPEKDLYRYILNGKKKLMETAALCTDMHEAHPVDNDAGDGIEVVDGRMGC